MDTLAILMPVKNGARHVNKAIDSIVAQTAFVNGRLDYKIILVDNASTDNLKEAVRDRVKVEHLYCEEPGVVPARNTGIFHILNEGKYSHVAILDCDDEWHPNKLDLQFSEFFNKKDLDICGSGMRFFRDEESFDVIYPETHEQIMHDINSGKNPFGHSSIVYHKRIFKRCGGYDETYRYCEDYDLLVRACKHHKAYNIPKVLVNYDYSRKSEQYLNEQGENTQKLFSRILINNNAVKLF